MRHRIEAGAEEAGEDFEWKRLANVVAKDKYAEKEDEYRCLDYYGELQKRVERQSPRQFRSIPYSSKIGRKEINRLLN